MPEYSTFRIVIFKSFKISNRYSIEKAFIVTTFKMFHLIEFCHQVRRNNSEYF